MSPQRAAIISTIVALATVGTACTGAPDQPPQSAEAQAAAGGSGGGAAPCPPLEKREANGPDQRPAFPGQTRACAAPSNVAFDVVVLTKELEHPWAVEPLPGGDLLVTEKPGRLRVVSAKGTLAPPITGVPKVDDDGQGGLLDVALSPTFESDRTIYLSYSEPRRGGNATSVARGVLSADRRSLGQVRVILRAMPTYDGNLHYGSRLAFGPDEMLYVTLGERSDTPMRPQAQRLDSHMGKILRIGPDGTVPKDNPFVGRSGALPEIWTLGHRNIQAAAFDEEGRLWEVEHGTRGGDELNLVEKGKNYGWPIVAYGVEYSGRAIAGAVAARDGFEQPVYYWDPVIAPSGAQFYTGDAFPAWRGSLFVGSLRDMRLVRLTLEDQRVTGEEHLLADRRQRVRDVRQGPDGALYVVTDQGSGELWRIAPRR
ncbi:MAG: PQQ-dependent sugar dehydrogenase [Gemmatimonadales bacterium]|nr:PQQ-dependent sugar dehydrogenase [Gemmatimonadales bacterium]